MKILRISGEGGRHTGLGWGLGAGAGALGFPVSSFKWLAKYLPEVSGLRRKFKQIQNSRNFAKWNAKRDWFVGSLKEEPRPHLPLGSGKRSNRWAKFDHDGDGIISFPEFTRSLVYWATPVDDPRPAMAIKYACAKVLFNEVLVRSELKK